MTLLLEDQLWQYLLGGVKFPQFDPGEEGFTKFHIPHDYAPGTDLFIHAHWACNSSVIDESSSSVTWGFEMTYAKGYSQMGFSDSKTLSLVCPAKALLRNHHISEIGCSTPGGSGSQLDTNSIEPDGLLVCRVFLISNDITTTDGSALPAPFLFGVDIHYQSTSIGTKNKNFPFYAV